MIIYKYHHNNIYKFYTKDKDAHFIRGKDKKETTLIQFLLGSETAF